MLPIRKTQITKLVDAAIVDAKPIAQEIRDQAREWLSQFKSLEDAKAGRFHLDTERLSDRLATGWFLSCLYGYHEIFEHPHVQKLTGRHVIAATQKEWTPIPFQQAIDQFKRRKLLTRDEFDQLEAAARRHALTAATMSKETIETRLRAALIEELERGGYLIDFQEKLADIVLSDAHAETIFRTNVLNSYSTGVAEGLYDPQLADMIPAVEFVAVIDDRTTEMCEERDGQIFSRAEMATMDIVPPLHFDCRSTLVGVFDDEFTGFTNPELKSHALEGFGEWRPSLT